MALLASSAQAEGRFGFGRAPSAEEIAGWNIDIDRDAENSPPGAAASRKERPCSGPMRRMPGAKGEGGSATRSPAVRARWRRRADQDGRQLLALRADALRLHPRAMPMNAPQSLRPDEVYALVAYVLNLNGLVPDDAVMDAARFPR